MALVGPLDVPAVRLIKEVAAPAGLSHGVIDFVFKLTLRPRWLTHLVPVSQKYRTASRSSPKPIVSRQAARNVAAWPPWPLIARGSFDKYLALRATTSNGEFAELTISSRMAAVAERRPAGTPQQRFCVGTLGAYWVPRGEVPRYSPIRSVRRWDALSLGRWSGCLWNEVRRPFASRSIATGVWQRAATRNKASGIDVYRTGRKSRPSQEGSGAAVQALVCESRSTSTNHEEGSPRSTPMFCNPSPK